MERFRSSQGDFAACGRRVTLPTAAKSPKRRRGRLRTPFTGATPSAWQKISGAQNQECLSAIPSGPTGGLSLQNLEHLRFKICAWLCRTNAPGAFPP